MKRIMLMGRVACGKTTLCQYLLGEELSYQKTQTIQILGDAIDTPGEYVENRALMRGLTVTAVDADVVLFLQDCTDLECRFSPGQAAMYGRPVVGVVTKADLAPSPQALEDGKSLLKMAGADPVFCISSYTGEGVQELVDHLEALPTGE